MTPTPTELTAAKEGPDEAYTDAQVETVRRVYEQWPEFRPSPEAGARDTRHLLGAIARLREELATARKMERERCAKVCDHEGLIMSNPGSLYVAACRNLASFIRALPDTGQP